MAGYTDAQVKFIKQKKSEGKEWKEITTLYNQEFLDNKTENAIRKTFKRFEEDDIEDTTVIESLEKSYKATAKAKKLQKTQTALIESQITLENVLEQLKNSIKLGGFKQVAIPKYTPSKIRKEMAIEILYSDIHAGQKSKTFNLAIMETRLKEFSNVILGEIERNSKFYDISTIIFACLGDMIENSYFHGLESMSACEFENSEQIRVISELTFKYFILPLAKTGRTILVPCIPGNHDRWGHAKTYNDPGKNNISWIIYHFLRYLSEQMGLTNVEFNIAESGYCVIELFGKTILLEHGDEVKGKNENDIENHIHKRNRQVKKHIDFFRMGDKHTSTVYNKGRIIINGSVCGTNSYADVKGYSGVAAQTINFYINRKGCIFYKSFPVDLETIE